MMSRTGTVLLLSLLLIATGCASVPREAGSGEAQMLVFKRQEQRIHWKRGTPEVEEISRKIDELLREELFVEAAV